MAALTQERAGAMRREPQNLNRAAAPGAPKDEPQLRDEDGGRPGGRLHPRHWQGEGEPRGRPAVQLYSTQRHGQPAVAQQYGPPAHPHGPQPPQPFAPQQRGPVYARQRPVAAAPAVQPRGPDSMGEAVREAEHFDAVVREAEQRAGLSPEAATTTPAPEPEGDRSFLIAVVLVAVVFAGGALAYSLHLSRKTQSMCEQMLKEHRQQAPQQPSAPPPHGAASAGSAPQ